MLEKLQKITREHLDDDTFVLTEDMVLRSDLGLNSFELVQMVCVVEDAFNVEIPDRIIGGLKTIKDVLDFIENAWCNLT